MHILLFVILIVLILAVGFFALRKDQPKVIAAVEADVKYANHDAVVVADDVKDDTAVVVADVSKVV